MITEDYVNFEVAELLKEKGFDVYVRSYYEKNEYKTKEEFSTNNALWNYNISSFRYSAPTLQMAIKWLREVHEIFIRPNISFLRRIKYYCEIFCYGDNLKTQQDVTTETFENPEEACEEAIKYCLKNLI